VGWEGYAVEFEVNDVRLVSRIGLQPKAKLCSLDPER
jgi:hypothetical protein